MSKSTSGWGYEVIQRGEGGAARGNHWKGATGIRFRSIGRALMAAARVCQDGEEWRVVELLPGEPLDYDGIVVGRVTWERGL